MAIHIFFSDADDHKELQHDVETSIPKIEEWKAHILRAAHQDAAKTDVIENMKANQVLLIMDWAMKFLPASFRETQRDWFGKKGKSWHVCVAVLKSENGENEVNHAAIGIVSTLFASKVALCLKKKQPLEQCSKNLSCSICCFFFRLPLCMAFFDFDTVFKL